MFNPTNLSFLMIALFFTSCQKNPIPDSDTIENKIISNRSMEDDQWLIDFQSYLRDIHDENLVENPYTLEEAIYGTEALMNLAFSNIETGVSVFAHRSSFQISETSNWGELFDLSQATVLNILQENQDTNIHIGAFNIKIDSTFNGLAFISTNTILQNTSEGALETANGSLICDDFSDGPFGPDDSYILGVGGWTEEEPNGVGEPCLDIDGIEDCGGIDEDSNSVLTTGPDQIEDRLNLSVTSSNECPAGTFLHYVDIQEAYIFTIEWYDGFDNCSGPYTPPIDFRPCDCMSYQLMNCIFCTLKEALDNQSNSFPFYIDIPPGYELISINIGVDFLGAGGNFEDYHTAFSGTYYYGKPICKPDPKGGGVIDPVLFPLLP